MIAKPRGCVIVQGKVSRYISDKPLVSFLRAQAITKVLKRGILTMNIVKDAGLMIVVITSTLLMSSGPARVVASAAQGSRQEYYYATTGAVGTTKDNQRLALNGPVVKYANMVNGVTGASLVKNQWNDRIKSERPDDFMNFYDVSSFYHVSSEDAMSERRHVISDQAALGYTNREIQFVYNEKDVQSTAKVEQSTASSDAGRMVNPNYTGSQSGQKGNDKDIPTVPKVEQSVASSDRGPVANQISSVGQSDKKVGTYVVFYSNHFTAGETEMYVATAPESFPDEGLTFVFAPDEIRNKHWDAIKNYAQSQLPNARSPFAAYQGERVSKKSIATVLSETKQWMTTSVEEFKTMDATRNRSGYTMMVFIIDPNTSQTVFSLTGTRPRPPAGSGYFAPR
ncbi:MAG: hypothetical protein ABSE41_14365 [Bacteroidota bacterium]